MLQLRWHQKHTYVHLFSYHKLCVISGRTNLLHMVPQSQTNWFSPVVMSVRWEVNARNQELKWERQKLSEVKEE